MTNKYKETRFWYKDELVVIEKISIKWYHFYTRISTKRLTHTYEGYTKKEATKMFKELINK